MFGEGFLLRIELSVYGADSERLGLALQLIVVMIVAGLLLLVLLLLVLLLLLVRLIIVAGDLILESVSFCHSRENISIAYGLISPG